MTLGRLLCAIGLHGWGAWHSYRLGDLERVGKARTFRLCWRCYRIQDGPVCQ